jgi:hypothetical protein
MSTRGESFAPKTAKNNRKKNGKPKELQEGGLEKFSGIRWMDLNEWRARNKTHNTTCQVPFENQKEALKITVCYLWIGTRGVVKT